MAICRALLHTALLLCPVVVAGQTPGQLAAPAAPWSVANYRYITGGQRWKWYARSTVGPESLLAAGPVSAGWSTLFNEPEEYGPHWEGFGRRYRARLAGLATGNAIEAAAGAVLGEDPRYVPAAPGTPLGKRVKRVVRLTFTAYRPDGSERFSYARIGGNVGGNFLSNTWRVGSDSSVREATLRCVSGVTGRMVGNAFAEFLPGVMRALRRKKQ